MKVTIEYNQIDFDRAIEFVAARKKKIKNESFKNMLKEELFNIIDDLKNVVKPNVTVCSNSSMGFFVHVEDIVKESIENDEYIIKVKILLDVSNDYVFASKEYEVDLDE